jgi:hypothetical protein
MCDLSHRRARARARGFWSLSIVDKEAKEAKEAKKEAKEAKEDALPI